MDIAQTKAERVLIKILGMPVKDFVANCHGFNSRQELVESINGNLYENIRALFARWSDSKEVEWLIINGECRVAAGARIITFEHFKREYDVLFTDGKSEEIFKTLEVETIIEFEKEKYIMLGKTSKYPVEWVKDNSKEAMVWQNMNPEWYIEAGKQFVR